MSDSTPPERLRELEHARALDHAARGLRSPAHLERDHAAEARHLGLGDVVARVLREARVVHGRDVGVLLQERGDLLGVRGVALDADGEGLDPARGEPRVHGAGDGADGELEEADLLGERVVVEDHGAAEHVGVPAEVLGRGVHDDVGAERERLLEVRRGEGVVDDDRGAGRVAEVGERADVADLHQRVARRLDPQDLRRARSEDPLDRGEVAHVDGLDDDAPVAEHAREEAVGAAVHVVAQHDAVARAGDRAQQGVLGGEPGGERERVLPPLERREQLLQPGARRVGAPRVLVAAAEPADAVLHEGAREVQRRDDGARGGIRVLAGVDRAGVEVVLVAHGARLCGSGGMRASAPAGQSVR
ncbi:hypothetical protein ABID70_000115 [Clavibacter michiganensis]